MARLAGAWRRRSVAVIELALGATFILFPLIVGVMEYGWMFMKIQHVHEAAFAGARVAARAGGTNAAVEAAVLAIMLDGGMGGSGYTVTPTPAVLNNLPAGTLVTVEVRVEYSRIHLMGVPLIPVPDFLSGKVSMVR
jgi:Flp pilus assembly protein TadG